LFEKYLQLGRDATGSGDRVMAESYFQYAEHYFRILNAINQAQQQTPGQNGQGGGHYQGAQTPQYNGHRRHEREEGDEQPQQMNGPQAQPGYGDQPPLDGPATEDNVR
jgi:hypothetical protein